jgi:hypothetical protein
MKLSRFFGLDQRKPRILATKIENVRSAHCFCESIICDNAALRHCVAATGATDRLATIDPFRDLAEAFWPSAMEAQS